MIKHNGPGAQHVYGSKFGDGKTAYGFANPWQ